MKAKNIWLLSTITLFGTLLFSCAAQNAATPENEAIKNSGPALQPGQLVESLDAHTIRVTCTGMGASTQAAVLHARKGCVDWFIRTGLGLNRDEINKYVKMQEEIFVNLDKFIEVPGPASSGGRGKGIMAKTHLDANQVRLRCIVDLYKNKLKNHLSQAGLATSASQAGKPLVLAIRPSKKTRNHPKRQIIQNIIAAYLVKNGFEVVEIGPETRKEEVADIFVMFEATKEIKGPALSYSITLKAFEPTSGQTVGAGTAISIPRSKLMPDSEQAAIQEATQDALAKLEPQLRSFSRQHNSGEKTK